MAHKEWSHFPSHQLSMAIALVQIINNGMWGILKDKRQDCFYCSFLTKIKKLRVVLYNESRKTVLLSEDVESNPGPITNATWCISSAVTGRGVSDFLFNYFVIKNLLFIEFDKYFNIVLWSCWVLVATPKLVVTKSLFLCHMLPCHKL